MEALNFLRNQSKFSIDEIIPVLEEKISSMMNEEYKVDFFITNKGDSTTLLNVNYVAFPKQESYIKAAFTHDGYLYSYSKEDEQHERFKKVPTSDCNIHSFDYKDLLTNTQDKKVFIIGKEIIKVEEALAFLLLPHKEKYYLFNNFFCYGEEMDELSETIAGFAKQKVPTK